MYAFRITVLCGGPESIASVETCSGTQSTPTQYVQRRGRYDVKSPARLSTSLHAAQRPRWLRRRLASQAHRSWPPQPRKNSRPAGHASVPATFVSTTSRPQSCDRGSAPESASLMDVNVQGSRPWARALCNASGEGPVQKASQWRVNCSESHPWLFAAFIIRGSSASHWKMPSFMSGGFPGAQGRPSRYLDASSWVSKASDRPMSI